jgi:hypothetical protein
VLALNLMSDNVGRCLRSASISSSWTSASIRCQLRSALSRSVSAGVERLSKAAIDAVQRLYEGGGAELHFAGIRLSDP